VPKWIQVVKQKVVIQPAGSFAVAQITKSMKEGWLPPKAHKNAHKTSQKQP
jgi:hypothetical protein